MIEPECIAALLTMRFYSAVQLVVITNNNGGCFLLQSTITGPRAVCQDNLRGPFGLDGMHGETCKQVLAGHKGTGDL